MKNVLENKKIDMAAMENVTGGTVGEFADLVSALSSNGILKKVGEISSHLPIGNQKSAEIVEGILRKNGETVPDNASPAYQRYHLRFL